MTRDERMVIMKYTYKITASLLAALMMAGTAVAVPAADIGFGTSVSAAYNTYAYATNISYKLYNSCVKATWKAVTPCTYYLIQVCDENANIISTSYANASETSIVIPYTQLPLNADVNGRLLDTRYTLSVIGIYGNGINEGDLVPFVDSTAMFTVKPDMSSYEAYGKPENLTASCTNSSITLTWTNPVASSNKAYVDTFRVRLTDSRGNVVALSDTTKNTITINKLLYNNTYTATVTNTTYSAAASITVNVKAAANAANTDDSNYDTMKPANKPNKPSSKPSTSTSTDTIASQAKLAAPKNVKAKSGTNKITLSWSKVKGADGYRIYMYDEAKGKYVRYKTVTGTKCTVTGIIGDKDYKFRVAAVVYNSSTRKYDAGKASSPVTARCAYHKITKYPINISGLSQKCGSPFLLRYHQKDLFALFFSW